MVVDRNAKDEMIETTDCCSRHTTVQPHASAESGIKWRARPAETDRK
jgi:hypothetical protein